MGQAEFEKSMHKHFVHRLSTSKTPKSGTTRTEGAWRTFVKATRKRTGGAPWFSQSTCKTIYRPRPALWEVGRTRTRHSASITTHGPSFPSAPPLTSVLAGTKPLVLAATTMGAATAY